ncbi:MAG: hypothetical protein ACT4QF_13020 [Sporichthyaceae bacterium]
MSTTGAAARRRWAVVLAGIAALCSVPGLLHLLPADAGTVDLATLRSRILAADPEHSGYAETVGSLGLPDLPAIDDVGSLLGGRNRLRVWHESDRAWRVDVLTTAGERGQYATAGGTTTWNYEEDLRVDLIGFPGLRTPRPADLLPPALARRLISAAGPDAALEPLPARRVAGVAAGGLRVRPKDADTTVGFIDVWADPRTALPVAVDVTGKGGGPADLRSAFHDLAQGADAVPAGRVDPPPATHSQYAVADAPQVSAVLDERVVDSLPNRLAGRAAQSPDDEAPRALRVYGSGLAGFAALPLPPGLDRRIFRAARVGGASVQPLVTATPTPTAPASIAASIPGLDNVPQTAVIRTTLLTLVIVTDTADGAGYLLAGPVLESVLLGAAREIAVAAERRNS